MMTLLDVAAHEGERGGVLGSMESTMSSMSCIDCLMSWREELTLETNSYWFFTALSGTVQPDATKLKSWQRSLARGRGLVAAIYAANCSESVGICSCCTCAPMEISRVDASPLKRAWHSCVSRCVAVREVFGRSSRALAVT